MVAFYLPNYRMYNNSEINITLQEEGNKLLDYFTGTAIKSSEVDSIEKDDGAPISLGSSGDVDIKSIKFITKDISGNIVSIDTLTFYPIKVTPGSPLQYINVKPVPDGSSFKDAKGLYIKLRLNKEGMTKEIKSEVYFRN